MNICCLRLCITFQPSAWYSVASDLNEKYKNEASARQTLNYCINIMALFSRCFIKNANSPGKRTAYPFWRFGDRVLSQHVMFALLARAIYRKSKSHSSRGPPFHNMNALQFSMRNNKAEPRIYNDNNRQRNATLNRFSKLLSVRAEDNQWRFHNQIGASLNTPHFNKVNKKTFI